MFAVDHIVIYIDGVVDIISGQCFEMMLLSLTVLCAIDIVLDIVIVVVVVDGVSSSSGLCAGPGGESDASGRPSHGALHDRGDGSDHLQGDAPHQHQQ